MVGNKFPMCTSYATGVVCYQCRQALGASSHQLWADSQEGFTQQRGPPSCAPHWEGGGAIK